MAIRITTPPEPLSPNSYEQGFSSVIESDAYRLLTRELTRYCAGDVNGRSFLIAGHRGAGKTTLVSSAFLSVRAESRRRPQNVLQPLMVMLHGPNLLPDPGRRQPQPVRDAGKAGTVPAAQAPATGAAQSRPAGTAAAAPTAKELARDETDPEIQAALVQITLALHRAVCKQLAEHYRGRLVKRLEDAPSGHRQADLELAAQLDLELFQWPTAARLREFWARAGALPGGVLSYRDEPDQAFRELVALSAVCDCYRRISGTLSQTEKESDIASRTSEASLAAAAAGKDFFGPLVTVLTGGAVGTGLAAAGVPPVAATFAGAAGALASALTLKASVTRTRTRSRTREDNFLFDLSVTTLDRVLPMLIDALLRCGLAPVFVVDELDKVVDLQTRMIGMVHHLKKFVAERAFFCFLTDRLYFEQLQQLSRREPFPWEYTYFTHRLFVVFRPGDVQRYLLDHVFADPRAAATLPPAVPAETASPTPAPSATITTPDDQDRQVLPFVVLHRARMHPIDVQREIARLTGESGEVNLAVGEVRSSLVFRFDVTFQVAIETVLRGTKVAIDLARDPALYRVAYDAMYFLSRRWADDAFEAVDLREENQGEFDRYLDERIGRDDPTRSHGGDPAASLTQAEVPPVQKRLLYGWVRELARLLSQPDALLHYVQEAQVHSAVIDVVSTMTQLDPPLLREREIGVFEWGWDNGGRKLRASRLAADRSADWDKDAEAVESVDGILRKIAGPSVGLEALSSHGVIPGTPAWPQVQQAIVRLRRHLAGYSEQADDHRVLAEYASMLDRNVETIGRATLLAAAIGSVSPVNGRSAQIAEGLRVMSDWYRLPTMAETTVGPLLKDAWAAMQKEYALTAEPPASVEGFLAVRKQLLLDVESLMSRVAEHGRTSDSIDRSWQAFAAGIIASSPPGSEVPLLISVAAREGPARFFPFSGPPNISHWCELFARSLDDRKESEGVPAWFAPVALRQLGFDDYSSRLTFAAGPPSADLFENRAAPAAPEFLETVRLGVPSLPGSLIVTTAAQSIVRHLRSSRPIGALALTPRQLQQPPLVKYLAELELRAGSPLFQQLVIEMPADVKQAESAALPILTALPFTPRDVPKLFMYPAPPPEGSPTPQLIAPTSLDQILPAAT